MRSPVIASIFAILLILTIQPSITSIYADKEITPVIRFDRPMYGPFDLVQINIIYPPANADPAKPDTLDARIFTSSGISKTLTFSETTSQSGNFDTGVFTVGVMLTLDPDKWSGDLKVQRDDNLTVEFKTKDNMTFTNKVHVNFNLGTVRFEKDAYLTTEKIGIIVWDPDRNKNPNSVETLPVWVWSTTEVYELHGDGIIVTLREIDRNSSEFHGSISLTTTGRSSGTTLRVSDGDTVTARYADNTLIPADELSPKGLKTFAVREVYASALIGDCLCPPLERAIASEPEIFSSPDKTTSVTQLHTGDTAIIRTEIAGNRYMNNPLAYIIQVKNSDNVVVSLSWIRSELRANQTMNVESTWIPELSGTYTIESFTWTDIDRPTALGPQRTIQVEVR